MQRTFLLILSLVGVAIICGSPASATSGFNAGRIIDDSVFTNKNSMSVSDIQNFLNSKVPNCDTNGQQLSEFGGPDLNGDGRVQRWEWGKQKYNQTTFPCLKEYTQDGVSAAQLIYDASQTYSINPQVMIVLLQKEQGLITDTWPLDVQYRSATGYGCPDTAACDSQYYGLKNQIKWAATMFRAILNNSPTWYTPYVLGNNYIQYNPNSSCGGSNVYIQNRSTQALYNYTPYQPSQAVLDAGWGTVDCGAYGNRNFYLYFTNWFGSTSAENYTSLLEPRWMVISNDTYKKDPTTGQTVSDPITVGTQLRFASKVLIEGEWHLRTEYDTDYKLSKAIPLNDISDIAYEPMLTPRYLQISASTNKQNPRNGNNITNATFNTGETFKFTSKIAVNGTTYYRTAYDEQNNVNKAVSANKVTEVPYVDFLEPRFMQIKSNTHEQNPVTGFIDPVVIPTATQLRFTSKIRIGSDWYYRTEENTTSNTPLAILSTNIEPIPYSNYQESPYWLRLKTDTPKADPASGKTIGETISTGTQLLIAKKIIVENTTYYQTEFDATWSLNKAIPAETFEEIPYVALQDPRILKTITSTSKINPKDNTQLDGVAKGVSINFTTKILINNIWYLRSEFDTNNNLQKGIRLDYLQ